MEQQLEHTRDSRKLQLASRKCLFRLLYFLDRKLPEACAPYRCFPLAGAALSTANPSYIVYFRRQDMTNTTSISSADEEDYSVIIGVAKESYLDCNEVKKCWTMTAWTDNDEKLAGAYEAIDEIDWRDDVIVIHYKHQTLHQGITDFLDRKEVQGNCYPCDQYFLPTNDAINLQISIEIGRVYVKSLERCHAQLVYDHWPYRAGSTVEKVAKEIEELPSAGVFSKDNDKLVSWMMYHLPNGMSHLHTLQEYRRQGYAALVTQYLSKRVAQCGFVPFVNVHPDNVASYTLFTSTMGFRRLCYGHCYVTTNYPS